MKRQFLLLLFLFSSLPFSASCRAVPPEESIKAVRGVWLTNVDSDILTSRAKIVEAVQLCKELNINTIFAVTWNKGVTLYPSKVMKETFGIEMDTLYWGRDPLQELIEEAHKENIKVFAWFEFGFSSSYNLNGGHLLAAKPEWAAKDIHGNLVKKNNFEWMNAFHPDVQQFMLDLILEVVRNYDIDGIQGDDRLPALPSSAGYDAYTVEKYKKEHNGANPPEDYKDSAWVQWRADILNLYMKDIFESVKKLKPGVIVSMAPSIYPWSKEEYLQDWPTWLENGWVELICPQVYRYDIKKYTEALTEIVNTQIKKDNYFRFYPGVLIKVGKYQPEESFLSAMIDANRKAGLQGEVFFFYEGIKKYKSLLKEKLYSQKAVFPELLQVRDK